MTLILIIITEKLAYMRLLHVAKQYFHFLICTQLLVLWTVGDVCHPSRRDKINVRDSATTRKPPSYLASLLDGGLGLAFRK